MKTVTPFTNRQEAGQKLASLLTLPSDAIIIAIPRGGVVVGYELAKWHGAPLDVIVPRKLRAPEAPELAIGAVCAGGEPVTNRVVLDALQVSSAYLHREVAWQQAESQRRERQYRGRRPPLQLEGRSVILTDDGIATGHTMRAAVRRIQRENPASITVAVPASPARILDLLSPHIDRVMVLYAPEDFDAVDDLYQHFDPVSDDEVLDLLGRLPQPAEA